MELRHFITFHKIVELGSFTRAAEHLGYAQSSVTAHIQALEESIGSPLFDRVGKKVMLTNAGMKLLNYSTELLDTYQKIQNISTENNVPQGVIKIGSLESLMIYRLYPILGEYKRKYPQVDIFLKTSPWWELREGLYKGELDIAFFIEYEVNEADLVIEKLIDEKMCFLFPEGYQVEKELDFINKETIIYARSYRKFFENFLHSKGIMPENCIEIGSVETIKKCVISGIGISLLPLISVQNEINEGKLTAIPWEPQKKRMVTQMAYHKNKWISPAMEKFIQIIREHSQAW